jgi:putative transposase
MSVIKVVCVLVRNLFVNWSILIAENLSLRQQLAVQKRTVRLPKLNKCNRIFWVFLSRIRQDWKSALIIVKPETVNKWHHQVFKLYWRWKSRTDKVGRPRIPKGIRNLIRQMSQKNPTLGASRIQSELRLLGYEVADSTVANAEQVFDNA